MMPEHSKTSVKLFSTMIDIIATRTLPLVLQHSLLDTSSSVKSRQLTANFVMRKMTSLLKALLLWTLITSTHVSWGATRSIAKWVGSLCIHRNMEAPSNLSHVPTVRIAFTRKALEIKDKSLYASQVRTALPWTKAWLIMATQHAGTWTIIRHIWTLSKWLLNRLRNRRSTTHPFRISAAIRIRT